MLAIPIIYADDRMNTIITKANSPLKVNLASWLIENQQTGLNKQRMFFVATAPLSGEGLVNLSYQKEHNKQSLDKLKGLEMN